MFEALFARLSDRYYLVAPDYPGFGHSDWPDPKQFDYTFDHIASVMDDFTPSTRWSVATPKTSPFSSRTGDPFEPGEIGAVICFEAQWTTIERYSLYSLRQSDPESSRLLPFTIVE